MENFSSEIIAVKDSPAGVSVLEPQNGKTERVSSNKTNSVVFNSKRNSLKNRTKLPRSYAIYLSTIVDRSACGSLGFQDQLWKLSPVVSRKEY